MLHLLNIVWSILNTVLRGYLIKTFWAWFIVTQFPGLPKITILPALGFSFFVGAMTPSRSLTARDLEDNKMDADDRLALSLVNAGLLTLGTLLTLGAGWVLHHFMG